MKASLLPASSPGHPVPSPENPSRVSTRVSTHTPPLVPAEAHHAKGLYLAFSLKNMCLRASFTAVHADWLILFHAWISMAHRTL